MDYLSDNQDGRHLSVYIYHQISSKFNLWSTFIKLLFMSEYGFCPVNDYKDIDKTDTCIPFSLVDIRRGPLSESDCSSIPLFLSRTLFIFVCLWPFLGCKMSWAGGFMSFVGGVYSPGAPDGSTGSGSGFKELRRRGHGLLEEPRI